MQAFKKDIQSNLVSQLWSINTDAGLAGLIGCFLSVLDLLKILMPDLFESKNFFVVRIVGRCTRLNVTITLRRRFVT